MRPYGVKHIGPKWTTFSNGRHDYYVADGRWDNPPASLRHGKAHRKCSHRARQEARRQIRQELVASAE